MNDLEQAPGPGWEILSRPPYSPDMSPSDYHLFLPLDNHICNKKFQNREALETELNNFFTSKNHKFCRSSIHKLEYHWGKITDYDDVYFLE
jgi:histone-lysine N-methyltransferase SETMAR